MGVTSIGFLGVIIKFSTSIYIYIYKDPYNENMLGEVGRGV